MYYVPNYICDVTMDFYATSNIINVITCHYIYIFDQKKLNFIWGKNSKKSCTVCFMLKLCTAWASIPFDLQFHSINTRMHDLKILQFILSELMGGNSSANIVVNGSSLFDDFVILLRFKFYHD